MFDVSTIFRRRRPSGDVAASRSRPVHLSFATSRVGRTLSRTGVLLKKQIWLFPILAMVGLMVGGFFVRRAVEGTMRDNLAAQLQTLLDVESAMLETWMKVQESNAETQASALPVREQVYKLLETVETSSDAATLIASPIHSELRKLLGPALSAHNYTGYTVIDRTLKILSANSIEMIGRELSIPEFDDEFKGVLDGESVVTTPYPSLAVMMDEKGQARTGVPTMWALAPVRDPSFQTVAVLGLRIHPDDEFTRILQLGEIGDSGETYAFDKNGRLISNSRFDDELILLGIIPDTAESRSILNVLLRDPGGDMTRGHRPLKRRSELPFTKMAAEATEGRAGIDVTGYANYRGVPAVGAWKWIPKYDMGIATEINAAEAFRPLLILRWTFFSLLGLLALAALAIFLFTVRVARLQREAQKSAIESQRLGQYRLDHKLGSGGMGVVYKGHHAVLRRPTAIKLLNVDNVNSSTIERFEREVQITSQLNNPNTVAIYDYGRTEEGIFYYAMEFIDGIDLQKLVEQYGPQSEARTIHILRQVCGSLYEAHSQGLVHRDIKPANIMLARRGGEPDVAKVLDFGLVKAIEEKQSASMTAVNSLTGTPLYMSPESIQTPNAIDSRSDLYALGAVGYFLLTGKPVFDANNIVELCQAHVAQAPIPPSERAGREISEALEGAILSCLDKSRAKRPQTARDLAALLSRSPSATAWSVEEADNWWGRHERGIAQPAANAGLPVTQPKPTASADTSSHFGRTVITNRDDAT